MKNPYKEGRDKGRVEGSCKSITITMDEIEAILDGTPLKEAGGLRTELREIIEDSLIGLATKWYKKGFRRGHKVAFERHAKHGVF
ncbi:hypothetical protein KAT92_02475, partial [Candidatus Babeliales bacterium]|nr:hypothetical protein [Candidatus Babeliales bacterium]